MTIQQEISKRLKAHPLAFSGASADALRQIQQLCDSRSARALDDEIVTNGAGEILRIWATRMRIAARQQRTIEGAQALVAALGRMAPDHVVEQMAVEVGRRVGIVFFDETTQEPLGAILKMWDAPGAAKTAEVPLRERVAA